MSGKLFIGFSDITSLHLAINGAGLATVYGPMLGWLSQPREEWVWQSFLNVLKGDAGIPAEAPRAETVVAGLARGKTTGACLTLVTDSLGTPYSVEARGKILLLEDVGERTHRIDGALTHLLNSGTLDGVAGIVVGEMTETEWNTEDTDHLLSWREIVFERLKPLNVPMVVGYPFGHIPGMLTLPLGIEAELDADAGTLTYTESLCI
jgi:muramoyltetrapeptide carboxypeptidase